MICIGMCLGVKKHYDIVKYWQNFKQEMFKQNLKIRTQILNISYDMGVIKNPIQNDSDFGFIINNLEYCG